VTVVAPTVDVTIDSFLGKRVEALQPATGHHRSGLDAVLLAAALDSTISGRVADLGAGAGVAGFCAAARCPAVEVTLIEKEPLLAELAAGSLERQANRGFADRIGIAVLDIAASEEARIGSGLVRDDCAAVLTNPPFHLASEVRRSPAPGRAAAHVLADDLDVWFRTAAWLLRPKAPLVAITRVAAIADVLVSVATRFGDVEILPLHPRPRQPAVRLLFRATKGRRGKPTILPGLAIHGESGHDFSPALQAVLRDGAGLGEVHAPWQSSVAHPSQR
jgi:tRNA1(Val) A37 N6-methylase TrmN6